MKLSPNHPLRRGDLIARHEFQRVICVLIESRRQFARIDASSVGGVGGNIFLDNFHLDASPVPEPQTVAMIAMGSLLLFGFTKHRTRKQG